MLGEYEDVCRRDGGLGAEVGLYAGASINEWLLDSRVAKAMNSIDAV